MELQIAEEEGAITHQPWLALLRRALETFSAAYNPRCLLIFHGEMGVRYLSSYHDSVPPHPKWEPLGPTGNTGQRSESNSLCNLPWWQMVSGGLFCPGPSSGWYDHLALGTGGCLVTRRAQGPCTHHPSSRTVLPARQVIR